MKKKLLFLFIFLINTIIYAKDPVFILNKDVTLKDGNWDEYDFNKGDKFIFKYETYGFSIINYNSLEISIFLNDFSGNEYDCSIDDIYLSDYSFKINNNFSKDYWIPSYYYDLLKSNNPTNNLLKYETYWSNKLIQARGDNTITWKDEFSVLKYFFGNYFFIVFGKLGGYDDVNFFAYLEEVSNAKAIFNVQKMYSHFLPYNKQTIYNQPEFLPLYEKATPFKVIFTIDGDYMNMYIDEISENNLFQTLVRTTPEACDQIENFILGKSKDLSKVVMPNHGSNTATIVSQKITTNVAPNKVMTVSENLKLRSAEATTSTVLNVMAAGTKVKILEIGKAEIIDGINSNWVKVEIISGKDRNGNIIKSGTTGWCYGGYLE